MDNIKKIRKIAISDETQQKALIMAAKYNFTDMADKKIDIDELLSKIIESAIDLQFDKYTDQIKGIKEVQLNGDIVLEIMKKEGDNATVIISQQTNGGSAPLLDTSCKIVQESSEMGIQVKFNANQIFINKNNSVIKSAKNDQLEHKSLNDITN